MIKAAISIIHPTRGRPSIAFNVMNTWLNKSDHPENLEYIFSMDTSDPESGFLTATLFNRKAIVNDNKSAIEAINHAMNFATGDLIIVVSDDFSCPEHWDTLLLEALKGKEDFCVKTRDGLQPTLMTLPIMDRAYYNRFGYIYYPGYKHMYADEEMTAVAHMLGRNLFVDMLFEHRHYSVGKFKKDAISIKNDSTYPQGKALITERMKTNFGIANPVCKYSDIKWR